MSGKASKDEEEFKITEDVSHILVLYRLRQKDPINLVLSTECKTHRIAQVEYNCLNQLNQQYVLIVITYRLYKLT